MKLMIASDIHGDAETAARLIEAYRASGADKLLLLGDILYHGPRNDLPAGYAPKKVIELLNAISDELICVRGNCDTEVDQMVLNFPILAEYAILSLDGLVVYATHGHKFDRTAPPPMKKGEILLTGHTHIPAAEKFGDENFYINPGSVSIPKENSEKSYILYENREFVFYSLDGAVYDSISFE